MDYDRYDAFLHHIFKQTQGDAWFRPNEENLSGGVALRIQNDSSLPPEERFRIFPYENESLEPFEVAIREINPVVAVKVRSAAVHSALSDIPPEQKIVYVDADTRIQVLETMMMLPSAEREQRAAFIYDERVLVVWSDTLDDIIPICQEFDTKLIKLLWKVHTDSTTKLGLSPGISRPPSAGGTVSRSSYPTNVTTTVNPFEKEEVSELGEKVVYRRKWYGKKYPVTIQSMSDEESLGPEKRPVLLYAPVYNGLAAALAFIFIGNGINRLLREFLLDGGFIRFALCATLPLLYGVSLFFCLQIMQNLTMAFGPIAQYHYNSKYYSAIKPRPNKALDASLPHITIQMPVYKESLDAVLTPSIESIKKAIHTYARQGGTSSIFINDDGMRLLDPRERDRRLEFYANHGIGWVARPKHDAAKGGFKRAGRFKKASNMNYALELSLKAEKHLDLLRANVDVSAPPRPSFRQSLSNSTHSDSSKNGSVIGGALGTGMYGMQYSTRNGGGVSPSGEEIGVAPGDHWRASEDDLEERALELAIDEMYLESEGKYMPWAANGKAARMGEFILIVDSDTVVPEDCLRDAAREMTESENVAIIQHESDVMQVAHHYFENGIAWFTQRVNRCISITCANGEVAPFMGHNAFLRWRALQDAAFVDPADGKEKIWSESNVSEDFDMALRLQIRGYIIRWATYSQCQFKEGVSLSVDDELNRWQKYAYGCSELLFNPFVKWFRRGPINKQIHKFIWSNAPLHYKISMMAYMFSYYGLAAALTISLLNYALLGLQFPIDGFYLHSFEIWLANTVVFIGSGTIAYSLLEYRLGKKSLFEGFLENITWLPFLFIFFGGLSIPVTQAILAHLFSYNITWSATVKEVVRSNFFKEVPKIFKRFWFPLLACFIIICGMVVLSTHLVPYEWQIPSSAWAVIFPLAMQVGCHILFPIVLNPYLMVFSY